MKTSTRPRRPTSLYLLVGLLLFQGLSAVFGGYTLVADPTGERMQMPVTWLEGTPFSSYLIPGLILVIVLGIFPLFTAYALWMKPYLPLLAGLERLTHEHWALPASFTVGLALVIWITVQGMMLGFGHPLQIIYLTLGVAITSVSLFPSLRKHYATDERRVKGLHVRA